MAMRICVIALVAVLALLGNLGAPAAAAATLGVADVSPVAPVLEIFPVEPGKNTERGFAMALDGDLLAVSAPLDDEAGPTNAGAVYLFRWAEESFWAQEAKLFADPPQPGARFGSAVALRDGVLAVSALGEGAVYLFDDNTDDVWVQRRRLAELGEKGRGVFGRSVALDDDGGLLAVGAAWPHGRGLSAVYLYSILEAEPWTSAPQQLMQRQPRERFGHAVAVSGGLLVVGAPGHSLETAAYAGAAYVFHRTGTSWTESKLIAADAEGGDQLGAAVATDGTTVALGAPTADRQAVNSGATYVASCDEAGCSRVELVTNPDPGPPDQLGFSVGVDDDLLAAGVPGDPQAGETGGIRIYRREGGSWNTEGAPTPNNVEERDLTGFSVAVDGERVVAAAVLGDQGSAAAGAVWSFRPDSEATGTVWDEEGEAVARDPLSRPTDPAAPRPGTAENLSRAIAFDDAASVFGTAIAATNEYLAVGSQRASFAGEVYLFRRAGSGFRQEVRLTTPEGRGKDSLDAFGAAVEFDGTSLLVGAPRADVSPAGEVRPRAYLFSRSSVRWTDVDWFQPKEADTLESAFGATVAIDGGILAFGVPQEQRVVTVEPVQEELYQFDLLDPDGLAEDEFGGGLALRQGTLAIGAQGANGASGAVFVGLRVERGEWTVPPLRLTTPELFPSDRLGAAVALGEGVLAVGAPGRNGDGEVLLFQGSGFSWSSPSDVPRDGEVGREFGASVALTSQQLLIGAPGREEDPGHVFLYARGESLTLTKEEGFQAVLPRSGDLFGSDIALTDMFFAVTSPGPARGDRVTVFGLPRPAEEEP